MILDLALAMGWAPSEVAALTLGDVLYLGRMAQDRAARRP